jgi:hypothetical protein
MLKARGDAPVAVLFSLLSLLGCETRTTSVVIADTSRVTVVGDNPAGSSAALATAENTANGQRQTLSEGSFDPEPGAHAQYKVEAIRQNKEVALEWSTKVPVINGEQQTIIDSSGKFNDPTGVIALLSPETLKGPTFRFRACAHLNEVSAKGGGVVGFRATEWNPCSPDYYYRPEVPFAVETPWSNVVEIRDHTEVNVPGSIAIGVFGLGMTGGGVALIGVPKSCVGCVIGGVFLGVIGALTTITIALDLSDPARDGVTYPAKRAAALTP